jgi:hypothetical protein
VIAEAAAGSAESSAGSAEASAGSKDIVSLLNRNFVLLSQGQLVSLFGNQAFVVGMTFWVSATTHSAATTGLIVLWFP